VNDFHEGFFSLFLVVADFLLLYIVFRSGLLTTNYQGFFACEKLSGEEYF
jgi:hypothetical protein